MSFQCSKCPKRCSTQEQLDNHLTKPVPCDFSCRLCKFKAEKRRQYDYHVKSRHPKPKPVAVETTRPPRRLLTPEENKEMNRIQLVPTGATLSQMKQGPVDIIPVQDFSKDNLDLFCRLINLAKEKNADVTVTIHPREEHAKRAGNSFITSDYARTLQCLDDPNKINSAAANMLSNFHSDPSRPELHSIRLTDNARKIVKVYSRPEGPDGSSVDDAQCRWMPYAQESLLKLLTEHASRLLGHALAVVPNRLEFRYCVDKDIVCCCLDNTDDEEEGDDGVLILYAERDYTDSMILKVEFYNGSLNQLTSDDEEQQEQREILHSLMKEQGNQLWKNLQGLTLTEKDVMSFLERTRRLT